MFGEGRGEQDSFLAQKGGAREGGGDKKRWALFFANKKGENLVLVMWRGTLHTPPLDLQQKKHHKTVYEYLQ